MTLPLALYMNPNLNERERNFSEKSCSISAIKTFDKSFFSQSSFQNVDRTAWFANLERKFNKKFGEDLNTRLVWYSIFLMWSPLMRRHLFNHLLWSVFQASYTFTHYHLQILNGPLCAAYQLEKHTLML